MAERLDPKEVTSIEEIAVSNAWEIAALVKLLVQKGILTTQEVLDTTGATEAGPQDPRGFIRSRALSGALPFG